MELRFFLGCNTPSGFYSCFSGLTSQASRLYILKGGPGCGKSTMMKKIADRAEFLGADAVRIPCASDPGSLDGVWLRDTNTLYVDGTAPHVVEPELPGAKDAIIDLGQAWDCDVLEEKRGEIEALQEAISEKYRAAWSLMHAASELRSAVLGELLKSADIYKLTRRSRRIIMSHIPAKPKSEKGVRHEVFTSALTCEGIINLNDFRSWTVTELYDPYSIGGVIAENTASAAQNAGFEVFSARDPMEPDGAPLQVIVPEIRYVLMRTGTVFAHSGGCRRIRLDTLVPQEKIQNISRDERRMYMYLLHAAQQRLFSAKSLHDSLELIYRGAIDYSVTDRLAERELDRLERTL